MSDDPSWEIVPLPFNADSALLALKCFLRDQHALAERSEGWMLNGQVVIQLGIEGEALQARLARRPAHTPEWDRFTLKSAPDSRKLQDEIKRRLVRWKGDE